MKIVAIGGHRRNKTIPQSEVGHEPKSRAPEAGARREFDVPGFGARIPIGGIKEVKSIFRGEDGGRDSPGLNLRIGRGPNRGNGGIASARRRGNCILADGGKPDQGALESSGEPRLIRHVGDCTTDPNGLFAKRQMARSRLVRVHFSPDKEPATPIRGMKSQDIGRRRAMYGLRRRYGSILQAHPRRGLRGAPGSGGIPPSRRWDVPSIPGVTIAPAFYSRGATSNRLCAFAAIPVSCDGSTRLSERGECFTFLSLSDAGYDISPRPKLNSVNRSAAGTVRGLGPHARRKDSSAVVVSSLKSFFRPGYCVRCARRAAFFLSR